MKNYLFLEKQLLLPLYPQRGLVITKGKDVYLYSKDGKKYLDMMSNYGVNILGYSNEFIQKTFSQQIKKITNLHGSFTSDVRVEAAEKIVQVCDMPKAQVYFSNSGTEAIEAALKFAILATGKKKFIAMKNNYHGKTLGALSTMVGSKYQKPFLPLLWNTQSVEFGKLEELKKIETSEVAAVILEPIQGEGGIHVPADNYLPEVQMFCKDKNILLIVDEIQSGAGRTGKFLYSSYFDIAPDIICLGKGIAGGLPVGVTLVNQAISQKIIRGIHSSTFGGNPLTCAGIAATIDYLDEHKVLSHVLNMGDYFMKRLNNIKSSHIKKIRGKGLMIGVELDLSITPILKYMQDNGVLAIPGGEMVIRFLPPYIVEKKHIDMTIETLENALQ